MVAFGYNIEFVDEPQLHLHPFDPNKPTIQIIPRKHGSGLPYFSDWFEVTGRQIRLASDRPINQLSVAGASWTVEIKDLMQLTWQVGQSTVYVLRDRHYSAELLRFWVLHTILPILFTLDKTYTILHCGAIDIDDKVVLFTARSFGGKSTLTDFFLQKGHTLFADDSVGIHMDNRLPKAVASYPFHRPYREAESLGYHAPRVGTKPTPVSAVYNLTKTSPTGNIACEPLTGIAKYKTVHDANLINFGFLKEEAFAVLGPIADALPFYSISVPWDIGRLQEVYDAIMRHHKMQQK